MDLTGGSYSETRALDVENALGHPEKDTFQNQSTPSGTELDYFRFSVARDTSTWNVHNLGTMLTRLFWKYGADFSNPEVTGYYDASHTSVVNPIIRPHSFVTDVTQSGVDTVAVELMRPDEQPDSSTVTKRTLQITRTTPIACATFEGLTTWRLTDQYLTASCSSRGSSIRYRWQADAGGAWTPYSADTLYDFPGHTTSSTHQVTLEVKNTTTGASSFQTTPVSVQTGQVSLTGQTYITVKTAYVYRSNHSGFWLERYNPDLHWYPGTSWMQDTLRRVWAGGNYTVELRQDTSTTALRRGRLSITVCIPASGCLLAAEGAATAASPPDTSGIFGAGPWIGSETGTNRRVVRLYDLQGAHDLATPFTTTDWLERAGGRVADPEGAWSIEWTKRPSDVPGARVYDFTLTPTQASSVTFAMALDPDLGANPADDVAGYAADIGLLYVTDGAAAVGFLLQEAAGNAINAVAQYGVGRPGPGTATQAWDAVHGNQIALVGGPRDVQLLGTTTPRQTRATYSFAILRGTSLTDLLTKAKGVLLALHGGPS